jgi:hypothetical protein
MARFRTFAVTISSAAPRGAVTHTVASGFTVIANVRRFDRFNWNSIPVLPNATECRLVEWIGFIGCIGFSQFPAPAQ